GATLAFVVAGARTRDVYLSSIAFRLRMHLRVAVDFARRRLQYACPFFAGQLQHIASAEYACFHRRNGIALIMPGRSRAGEIIDLVYGAPDGQRLAHVLLDKREAWMV